MKVKNMKLNLNRRILELAISNQTPENRKSGERRFHANKRGESLATSRLFIIILAFTRIYTLQM
jgi:hypothetical protein